MNIVEIPRFVVCCMWTRLGPAIRANSFFFNDTGYENISVGGHFNMTSGWYHGLGFFVCKFLLNHTSIQSWVLFHFFMSAYIIQGGIKNDKPGMELQERNYIFKYKLCMPLFVEKIIISSTIAWHWSIILLLLLWCYYTLTKVNLVDCKVA